jgi:hypothetical protein
MPLNVIHAPTNISNTGFCHSLIRRSSRRCRTAVTRWPMLDGRGSKRAQFSEWTFVPRFARGNHDGHDGTGPELDEPQHHVLWRNKSPDGD